MHFFPQQVLSYHVLTFLVVTQQQLRRQKLLPRPGPSWGGPKQLLLGQQQLGGEEQLCKLEAAGADEALPQLLDDDGGGGDVDVGGCEGLGSS